MSLEYLYNLLTHISVISVSVPLIACFIKRKALNNTLRALFVYLCICCFSDLLSLFFVKSEEFQNQIVNAFTVLECSIICLIYGIEFRERIMKTAVVLILVLFLNVAAWQFILRHMFTEVDILVNSLEAVIIVILSAIYFIKFLITPEIKNLGNYYFFWIVLSNLLYFSTALIFFVFGNFINHSPNNIASLLWGFHDLINIACYILFAIAIWKVQGK